MNIARAIAFVQAHGSAVDRGRLAAILDGTPPSAAVLAALAARQRPDGGFAGRLPISTIGATAYALQWCDDLRLRSGMLVDAACRFLVEHRRPDGGWDEVDAVRGLDPPEWMRPGRIETRVWLTADCGHMLLRHGRAAEMLAPTPADFLLAHADASGRLPGYVRATWNALPVFAHYLGTDSPPLRRALAVTEAEYDPQVEGSVLAWLLRALRDAGLPADHPLVARALHDLREAQRDDGSWTAEDGEEFAAAATVDAVRALRA